MPLDPAEVEYVVDAAVQTIREALAPVLARLAVAEAQLQHVDALRERVTVVETKAHAPLDLTPLYERVAVLETKAPIPGPPGPVGPAGTDGHDGKDGNQYRGVFKKDVFRAEPGDWVTFKNQLWYCRDATTSDPPSDAWKLMKRED